MKRSPPTLPKSHSPVKSARASSAPRSTAAKPVLKPGLKVHPKSSPAVNPRSTSKSSPRPSLRASSPSAPKTARKAAASPPSESATKQSQLIALLRSVKGATMPQMTQLTGWLPHTVRGALSGSLRKRLGLNVRHSWEDGVRVYRIVAAGEVGVR